MENHEKYILGDREIYPYSGIFDFDRECNIETGSLKLSRLALDIAESIYGPDTQEAEDARSSIYQKLTKKDSSVYAQIKETLGVDLKRFIKEGNDRQKEEVLKLTKVLYHFIKKEDNSKIVELLRNPCLDNIHSRYYQYSFHTEVQEMIEVFDILQYELYKNKNKNIQSDIDEEYLIIANKRIKPYGDWEFFINEAAFRNKVFKFITNNDFDKVQKANEEMKLIKKGESESCRLKWDGSFNDFKNQDILRLFLSSMDRYYLKCMNNTFLSSLKDCNNFFDNTVFFNGDDFWSTFIEEDSCTVKNDSDEGYLQELFSDAEIVMLITGKKERLTDDEKKILELVKQEAKYGILNYRNLNWEDHYDGGKAILESLDKKTMWISVLQMLYICKIEKFRYTSESVGDHTQQYSMSAAFSRWNLSKDWSYYRHLQNANTWQKINKAYARRNRYLDKEECINSGQNKWLKNKGKERLIGKLLPQLVYVRNLVTKERFDEYIRFLQNYHDIQNILCEIIDDNEFEKNCDRFFDWLNQELDDPGYLPLSSESDEIEPDSTEIEAESDNDEVLVEDKRNDEGKNNNQETVNKEELAAIKREYSLFRKGVLLDESDYIEEIIQANLDTADIRMDFFERYLIDNLEEIYQGMKALLSSGCKKEYDVWCEKIYTQRDETEKMLKKYCDGYSKEAYYFVCNLLEKITKEKYAILKALLRREKILEYDVANALVLAKKKSGNSGKLKFNISSKEYKTLEDVTARYNKYEFILLSKLIWRK